MELEIHKENLSKISDKDLELNEESLFFVELMENLTVKRKTWNDDKKLRFIKNITVELYVTTKKELYIQENKLFELIKVFNLKNGAQGGTRTRTR